MAARQDLGRSPRGLPGSPRRDAHLRVRGAPAPNTVAAPAWLRRLLDTSGLERVGVEPAGDIVRIDAERSPPEGGAERKTPRFDVQLDRP